MIMEAKWWVPGAFIMLYCHFWTFEIFQNKKSEAQDRRGKNISRDTNSEAGPRRPIRICS